MKNRWKILLALGVLLPVCLLALHGRIFSVDAKDKPPKSKTALTIGESFHLETSLSPEGLAAAAKTVKKPPKAKTYAKAKVVKLPTPSLVGKTVEEAIRTRRSVRAYGGSPLTMDELSQILFAAQGISGESYGQALRTAPSAGALYPFEVYGIVLNVEGLPDGIYHYRPADHALEAVKEGDFGGKIAQAGLGQEMLGEAGVTLALAAVFGRTRQKYGERGFRYVYMEAGHIAQNVLLEAASLGLGSVCVGAFYDEKVNALLGIDGREEAAVYLQPVGVP
jgi:SagB-type dehydrogenase family enzyme